MIAMNGIRSGEMRGALVLGAALALSPCVADARSAQVEELSQMTLEELASVEVTSVSKRAQSLSSAPASIYVITREEILRSGVLSIPEALRLAPNLQVAQLTATGYAITARGFGDRREVQTQANKLLILIDGRTVYSPLFSGVFYDALDLVMDDIERIEVISGPGATLWGANAMNGVINIITRSSAETIGGLLRASGGNEEQSATARYGGRIGGETTYRVYAKAFERDALELADGSSAQDDWDKGQGGFRIDWQRDRNALTLQSDAYEADEDLPGIEPISISGGNAIARWEHARESSQFMVQFYYDRVEREAPADGAPFTLDTYDLEFQHSFELGAAHRIVWGFGKRRHDYDIVNAGSLQFLPPRRSLDLANAFAQDTIALGKSMQLTAGVKLEDNPYSDWRALPDVRLAWAPRDDILLWVAASQAIRSSTPFDAEVAEFIGPTLFLTGNADFRNEEVTAYEVGYRGQPWASVSLSVAAFYDEYDDLRTVEFGPTLIPLTWDNRIDGDTYGVEAWAELQVAPWWRLSPSVRTLHKKLRFKANASGLLDADQGGNDPTSQASLKSSMNLGREVTLDAFFRYVNDLPNPAHDSYYDVSARLGWSFSRMLDVSVSGFNLLNPRHTEYAPPTGETIERTFLVEARLRF
jgi:iron complex outermembrane receptor protein